MALRPSGAIHDVVLLVKTPQLALGAPGLAAQASCRRLREPSEVPGKAPRASRWSQSA